MRQSLRRVLSATAFVAITGCGGIGQTPPAKPLLQTAPAAGRTHLTYPTHQTLMFEADAQEHAVNIYQASALASNPPPIASITVASPYGFPYGLAVDQEGTLYVAVFGSVTRPVNEVDEYAAGSSTLTATITDGINSPRGLAIDKYGTLFVVNVSPPSITEYPYGSTSPSQTITSSAFSLPLGAAVDAAGNLYVADAVADQVFKIPAGTTTVVPLKLKNLVEPIGAAVDRANHYLWITDGKGDKVNVYKLGGSKTPLESFTGYGFPYAVSIENKGGVKGTVVISDADTEEVYAFKPGSYTPYATVNNGMIGPEGLLITQPL